MIGTQTLDPLASNPEVINTYIVVEYTVFSKLSLILTNHFILAPDPKVSKTFIVVEYISSVNHH